jgi:Domain of unknown function (DUF4158)
MPLIEDRSRPSSMAVASRCTTAPIAAVPADRGATRPPAAVVDYLAGQLDLADASLVKRYAERQSTQWEQAAEIR